tara:strand:- start:1370 stop:2404 length:1035 start_codon:yes stop_codon:yes gene_type:complete
MAELLNIDLLEKNILSLKKMNFQSFAIHHLANFNNFFHNIGSHEYEVEQQFGKRVDIRTVGPQSLIMINSVIYEYLNPSSKYHNDIISLKLPLDHYIKDNQLPATYNKKCTYEVISNAYALPIETIRRHCKIWLDTGIMKKSKERGLYTDFDVVFNSNLFRQTHFTIANKMIKAWEKLINNMNELDFIENKISFKPRSIDNIKQIEKLDYIKIIFNLNYFWYRASNYLKLSPLTFTELSVLSSAFYFKEEDKILYAHKNTDYYDNNILIPTNINSIANATLIPRETARRCVHSLIEKQILKKSSNLIFVSDKLLEGKIEVNKNVKKEIIRDSLIVLKTFDQALN